MNKSQVFQGKQVGRTIGFPTINLDPSTFPQKPGVYACLVKVQDQVYQGALYFGPNYAQAMSGSILEIHLLNFDQDIYSSEVEYQLVKFVRSPLTFENMAEMQARIEADIQAVEKMLTNSSWQMQSGASNE